MAQVMSDDELEYVREFMNSAPGRRVFADIEAGLTSEWRDCTDAAQREHLWRMLQAVLLLQATLRDAEANKRLTLRSIRAQS